MPDNKPLIRVRDYEKTELREGLAVVTSQTGWESPSDGTMRFLTAEQIVLKKSGDEWKFIWSAAVNIHMDLEWNSFDRAGRSLSPAMK